MFNLYWRSHTRHSVNSVRLRLIPAQDVFNQIVSLPQVRPPSSGDEWWALMASTLSSLTRIAGSRSIRSLKARVEHRLS